MAITFDHLQNLLQQEGLNYYVAPNRPIVRMLLTGYFGRHDVLIRLDDEGQFLQFRVLNYLQCRPDHPHLHPLLRILTALNFSLRLVKFAWDASDGEVTAYADLWLMDNTLTREQLRRMFGNYVPSLDSALPRLQAALETGQDPGDQEPATLAQLAAAGKVPITPALRHLLENMKQAPLPPPPAKPPEPKPPEPKPEIKEI